MNQPCSKACCCWCRGTCGGRYNHVFAPAHPERESSRRSSSESRVDTVRCRYPSRLTVLGHFFFRLPFIEVPSFFFELPTTKSIVVVPQKVTEGAIFRPLFLDGYYVDSSGVRVLLHTARLNAGHD